MRIIGCCCFFLKNWYFMNLLNLWIVCFILVRTSEFGLCHKSPKRKEKRETLFCLCEYVCVCVCLFQNLLEYRIIWTRTYIYFICSIDTMDISRFHLNTH